MAEDARFDGIFVLRTNTALDPLQAMLRYRELQGVEQLFRLAGTQEGAPGPPRRLAAAGLVPEWAQVRRDLDRLQEVEVAQDGKRFVLRTPVTGYAGKLFQTLGVALPPNIRDAAPNPPRHRRRIPATVVLKPPTRAVSA